MSRAFSSFKKNIESIKTLDNLYMFFYKKLSAIDLSEILRAELVLIVSAFDCYIHDAIKEGMLEIFKGERVTNNKFDEFNIPLAYVQQIINSENKNEQAQLIETAIKKYNSKLSFQSPSSIENAFQLISIKKIWTALKESMEMDPKDIKTKLGLIVNRRNKIAHEADIDHLTGEKVEITHDEIIEIFNFIIKLTDELEKLKNDSTQHSV